MINTSNKKELSLPKSAVIVIILILSLACAVLASSYKLKTDYSVSSGTELVNSETEPIIQNDVVFDTKTGCYEVTGEDPYIIYSDASASIDGNSASDDGVIYKGVFIELNKPADKDVQVKVYWTRQGDGGLSEKLSRTGVILAGQKTAYIKLSSYPLNLVRVDISESCVINKLVLADGTVAKKYLFGSDFIVAVIWRMVLIAAVLWLAYLRYCETGKVANETAPVSSKIHKYEFDYIRTLAAVLVIMMHSICDIFVPQVSYGDAGYGTLKTVLGLSLSCNTLYIMLSGALILKPKKTDDGSVVNESLKDFYLHRMTKVLIPTLCYFGLYMFLGYREEIFGNGLGAGLLDMLRSILSGRPAYMPHIWLVYTILGLYIMAPFLRIIIAKISDAQLFGLLLAGFIINILVTYLPLTNLVAVRFNMPLIANMTFGIDTPIASWMGIFMLGYYMTTDHAKKYYNVFIVLGVLGVVASILMIYFNPDLLAYTANWTPNMWLAGCGVFAFFGKFNKVFGKKNVVIEALSKYNFSIMLVHILILMKVVLPVGWRLEYEYGHLKLCIIGIIVVSLVLSYVCSFIYDNTAVAAAYYVYDRMRGKRKN